MEATGRRIGLLGATGVGVGAIVGGGILALAGVAFATTGPGAIAAFALNGVVALVTALSFAELSSRFPQSGGTYTFAKKVLSLEAAFAVGWVVWFASIVAATLYAIGFAAFAGLALDQVLPGLGVTAPTWLGGWVGRIVLAVGATAAFTIGLMRGGNGGGAWINVGKLLAFTLVIAGGLWALAGSPAGTLSGTLRPFLPEGTMGLVQAMGFTFIALQGFDLIAAVAGEVREPARTIPRAMLLSLGTALAIYLPLLLIIATVGVDPATGIQAASAADPEAIVAVAAGNVLGPFGYWLIVAAAILSMLSALQANLFAASRVARAMAADRTLPPVLEHLHPRRGTPVNAVLVTATIVVLLLLAVPDVAAAGAAASLIFLVTFALAHGISMLARRRARAAGDVFRTPFFPLVPIAGGAMCLALAIFQAIVVPSAGTIAAVWLGVGGVLFLTLFARRARVRDAATQATDPHLLRLRGRSPLVLVPIGNPANAAAMVEVANAIAAPGVGRVMLLNVVDRTGGDGHFEHALTDAQAVLRESLIASHDAGLAPEALTTVAEGVWPEIERVARTHDCESVLLGLTHLDEHRRGSPLEQLLGTVGRDTVVLRAPSGWRLSNVKRILVPVGGRGHHDVLRARLVASLGRGGEREITYLRVTPPDESAERIARTRRLVARLALDESHGRARIEFATGASVSEVLVEQATSHDLVILGLPRHGRRQTLFGDLAPRIAQQTASGIIMISRGA